MKICVFGAGAMGGHVAARLLAGGQQQTSVVARGAHLLAIQRHGLRLQLGDRLYQGQPYAATDAPHTLPKQDLVIVALKAQALPAAAVAIHQLLKPEGQALFLLNGIPWWWNHGLQTDGESLPLLDPQADLWQLLRHQTLGAVCHTSNEVIAPGVIKGTAGDRWLLGDPLAASSPRLDGVLRLFQQAGFHAAASTDLRIEIWEKLLINAALNPLSALTRLPSRDLTRDPQLRQQMLTVVDEIVAVARACGWDLQSRASPLAVESWFAPERRPPDHRTSMLQDVLAGRSLETEALLGQPLAFARQAGVATPLCDVLLPLLRGLAHSGTIPASLVMRPHLSTSD